MNEDHPEGFGLSVEVVSRRFETDSDPAREAVMDLADDLKRELGDELPKLETPDSGNKGDPVTVGVILISLITSGAVVKALDCIKTWISKDPAVRELRIKGNAGGKEVDLTITAKNVGDDEVAKIISAVAGAPSKD